MFALCECARARTRELLAFHRAYTHTQRLILLFKMLIEPNICFNEQRDRTQACMLGARWLLLLLLLVTHALSLPPPPSPPTLACDAAVDDADLWPRRLFHASRPAQPAQQPQELCIRFGLV